MSHQQPSTEVARAVIEALANSDAQLVGRRFAAAMNAHVERGHTVKLAEAVKPSQKKVRRLAEAFRAGTTHTNHRSQ